ncbi:MAG: tRNA (guanosine(37)-N1)-methyltransferase TrmD [Acidobacteriota bacterium]|nr:tRNA (guanosine(37)-N1)-methyltransferase TrmD [Acidobacteriota bacterium]
MRVTIVTIFPELFAPLLSTSLLGRAVEKGFLEVHVVDLRQFAEPPHHVVDDEPYGGGAGMVMQAPPWIRAVRELSGPDTWKILLSPQGQTLSEAKVRELSTRPDCLFLCARYEGVDERVRRTVVDEEISIGDYVVAGGEVPAMVLLEAVSRQLPGVVGRSSSVENDSFRSGILDFPHYTRPRDVEGMAVPDVLLSGNHAAIEHWRQREALRSTLRKRPDLLAQTDLTAAQEALLREIQVEDEPHAKVKS